MGRFNGVLICSDFDGTLAYKKEITQENCDAIAYFQSEGGIFCPCSGRMPAFFHDFEDRFVANGPVITLNGSVIARYGKDGAEDEILYEGSIPRELVKEITETVIHEDGLRAVICYDRDLLIELVSKDYTEESLLLIPERSHKVIFYHTGEREAELKALLREHFGDRMIFGSSWPYGIEGQMKGDDKGTSVLRVKEMVGAHTLVCVGDYENDIPMLKVADISYATGNAIDETKAAADRVTVPCTEHAIAQVIEDLKEKFS